MLVSVCAFAAEADEAPVIKVTVGSVSGEAGEMVTVPVNVESDLPLNHLVIRVTYDMNVLEYIEYAAIADKGDIKFEAMNGGLNVEKSLAGLAAASATNVEAKGLFGNFRFNIKENVSADVYPVKVIYVLAESDSENGKVELTANNTDGAVTVTAAADEDGKSSGRSSSGRSGNGSVAPITVVDKDESGKKDIATDGEAPAFTDLGGYDWAKDYILPLAKDGIIKGTSSETFSPANNITRADFIVLLTRLFGIEAESKESFEDIPSDAYYAEAVAAAKENGIAQGADNKFSPLDPITREQMIALVYRTLEKFEKLPEITDNGEFEKSFTDLDDISGYAFENVKALNNAGIIAGSNGKINPKGFATRAETAVIISRINNIIK